MSIRFVRSRHVHLQPIGSHVVHFPPDNAVEEDREQTKETDADSEADEKEETEDLEPAEVGVLRECEGEHERRDGPNERAEQQEVGVSRRASDLDGCRFFVHTFGGSGPLWLRIHASIVAHETVSEPREESTPRPQGIRHRAASCSDRYPVGMTDQRTKAGFVSGFAMGIRLLGRGFRLWVTSPRLMLIGAIPGLITLVLIVGAAVVLGFNLDNISTLLTPFAASWDEGYRTGLRIVVMAALAGVGLLVFVYSYTAITLLIGQPFFEKISERVELSLGGVPNEVEAPILTSLVRGIGESLRILLVTIAIGLGLFILGFIPLIGTLAAWTLGAITGGWFLALELSTVPFERRGIALKQRRAALAAQRSTTLGFGIAVFLLFLVPLGALVTMPAAAAGATLLARRSLGETDALPRG